MTPQVCVFSPEAPHYDPNEKAMSTLLAPFFASLSSPTTDPTTFFSFLKSFFSLSFT